MNHYGIENAITPNQAIQNNDVIAHLPMTSNPFPLTVPKRNARGLIHWALGAGALDSLDLIRFSGYKFQSANAKEPVDLLRPELEMSLNQHCDNSCILKWGHADKAGGIIGPYFFKNDEGYNVTVNGDWYRAMITNVFIPELNNHGVQELWFQQDGATCHTARATIDLLKNTFGDRLISRFGPVNWPPRSCDLTPLDYFLWGYVKSLVYADKPQTLDHLEDNIRRVIADIRPQMLEKVIENWTSRLDYIRGSHMPEIIFKMEAYNCVWLDKSFHHLSVNHSITFKDPEMETYTNSIKGPWSSIKILFMEPASVRINSILTLQSSYGEK
ncbi:putative transposable element [Trichonephila clavipes]|nr:putative transposable element [Trichonephila clavipes]